MTRSQKIVTFIFLGLPCFCCLGGLGYIQYQINGVASGLDEELAKAKAMGVPTVSADLKRQVPDNQNGAKYYSQAMAMAGDGTSDKGRLDAVTKGLGVKAKPEDRAEAARAYAQLGPFIAIIEKAADMPHCDFRKDWDQGFNLLFPEFAQMKAYTKLLGYKAEQQSKSGDWRGALKTVERMQSISRHAGEDPILIGLLVQIANEAITHASFRNVISKHRSNAAFLHEGNRIARSFGPVPDFRHALEGEMVMSRTAIYQIKSLSEISAMSSGGASESDPFTKIAFSSKSLKTAFDRKLVEAYNELFTKMPKDSADWQAIHRASIEHEQWLEKDRSLMNTMNQILFPVFSQASMAVGRTEAQRNLTITTIDLFQQKLRIGHFPKSPSGPNAIDPFSDKPLGYKPGASGFLLYSVDQDKVDNGGKRETGSEQRDLIVDMRLP